MTFRIIQPRSLSSSVGLKRVVLVGDSIRMGYQEAVRRELAGLADIWAPAENGGNSENVLAHLDEWVISRQPDILHLNCGLHDLKKEFGAQQAAVPLERYRANLEAIFRRLTEETPRTRLIWATTTPVNEAWHHANKPFDRFEADVLAYNRVALEVCQQFAVPVNDLYCVIMEAGRDALLTLDGVHFGEAGKDLLGKAVAGAIRQYL